MAWMRCQVLHHMNLCHNTWHANIFITHMTDMKHVMAWMRCQVLHHMNLCQNTWHANIFITHMTDMKHVVAWHVKFGITNLEKTCLSECQSDKLEHGKRHGMNAWSMAWPSADMFSPPFAWVDGRGTWHLFWCWRVWTLSSQQCPDPWSGPMWQMARSDQIPNGIPKEGSLKTWRPRGAKVPVHREDTRQRDAILRTNPKLPFFCQLSNSLLCSFQDATIEWWLRHCQCP